MTLQDHVGTCPGKAADVWMDLRIFPVASSKSFAEPARNAKPAKTWDLIQSFRPSTVDAYFNRWTSTGKHLAVFHEADDDGGFVILRPITAYEVPTEGDQRNG